MIKNIIGYEGLYVINDSNIDDETVFGIIQNHFIKTRINNKGYKTVVLRKNGVGKTYSLHRLLAEAFIPNPDNKPCVDHINTIITDNRIENLRWATHQENSNNPTTLENMRDSQINNPYKSLKVYQYNKDGSLFRVWKSVGECARNGYNKGHVAACCRGEAKSHKGYIWKYENNR